MSTEWVDYVEEPMTYQALRPHFFSVGGWLEGSRGGWVGLVVRAGVVGGGKRWVGAWGGGVVGIAWVGDVVWSGWGGGVLGVSGCLW